jgi:hypothetical protein
MDKSRFCSTLQAGANSAGKSKKTAQGLLHPGSLLDIQK